ncbi:MAG TPA: cytochrome c-type biogenesis CcmF C-terminal domain-containing protein, partial [Rhodoblastus sp.]|nr:cytochrome c-type biogenesis CcmF C-terminal domain-containing protein [Rhodoblastus sp.]
HAGLGLTLIGIVCETAWGLETIGAYKPGATIPIGGYELKYEGVSPRKGPNYTADVARITVKRDGREIGVMEPSKRAFSTRSMNTSEAALMTRGLGQLYVALGDINADKTATVRVYWKPYVLLIWIGGLVMALGGALSLSDRRLRVGAPKMARNRAQAERTA